MSVRTSHRARPRALVAALAACVLGAAAARADPPPLPADHPGQGMPFLADSGPLAAPAADSWSAEAGAPDATWVRVFFGDRTRLGPGSRIRLTSLYDGDVQHLDAVSLAQWNRSSAYFNGSHVLVELLPGPRSGGDRVVVDGLWIGAPSFVAESLCGADDRVLSTDPRVGRMLAGGCTAWLINECFLSAGHCMSSNSVVQFNVPLSNPDTSLNHPPASDQYTIDFATNRSRVGLIGDDWAYFGAFPNSQTGLTPLAAQGDRFELSLNVPAPAGQTLQLTGHGTDFTPNTHYLAQQTDTGPYMLLDGTTALYLVDTEGGSSGSPVYEVASGRAFAIHTNAGCNASETNFNRGTALNNALLIDALRSPLGSCAAQPACDNDGTCDPGEDCLNCVADCAFQSGTFLCGNGICEIGDGETCLSCPDDCNRRVTGPPEARYCCGDDVGCEEPGCTGGGNVCTETPAQGHCCGDGLCENAEDAASCAVDCAAPCVPAQEVTNVVAAHGAGGALTLSWDASTDPCFDHYVVLGSVDPSSAGAFAPVADTGSTPSYTGDDPAVYYLVVIESATGEQGTLGHFGQ